MTTIRSFKIRGLAGRQGVVARVLDPFVNVLWGLNGSGKTTLLRILDSALSNDASHLYDLPFESAEVTFYSATHDLEIVRTIKRSQLSPTGAKTSHRVLDWALLAEAEIDSELARRLYRAEGTTPWTTKVPGSRTGSGAKDGPFRHRYLPISRILEPVGTTPTENKLTAEERFVRHINRVWTRYSAQSLATIRDIQQFGLAEVLAILFGGISDADRTSEVGQATNQPSADMAWRLVSDFLDSQRIRLPLGKRDFLARYEDSLEHRHVVAKIESVMAQVYKVLEPQRELQSVIDEMYIGNKHLVLGRRSDRPGEIAVRVGEEAVSIALLSSGEKQLLQILLETLAIEESTIMIDEPELSMHPDWQKGLVQSMRRVNPGAQFILATHSPELMLDVPAENVFEL